MAAARFNKTGDVVLTLNTNEALYVAAELAGGNSYFHGVGYDNGSTVYQRLVELLSLSELRKNRFGLLEDFRSHLAVSKATRPEYDNNAGRKVARAFGFVGDED